MFLSFKKQLIAGIDISDYSIEFLLLGKNKEILEYSRLELEKGIIENGKILNKEALIEKLKKILKRKNVKVIASLPESKTFIHLFELDKNLKPEELEKAVYEQAQKIIPLSPMESYWDFYISDSSHQNRQKVLYAGTFKELVDEYLEVFSMAGIEPVVFDLESASLGRALIPVRDYFSKLRQKEGLNESSLIIDMGARTSNISIFNHDGILSLSITIPTGGNDFTKAIAKKEIIDQIKETVKNYEEQFGENINKVILTGGSSLLPKLDEFFSVNLDKKVFIGDPLRNINSGRPLAKNMPTAIFANVVGLALRGIGKYEEGINLLRQIKPKKNKNISPKKIIIIAAVIIFLFLLFISYRLIFKSGDVNNTELIIPAQEEASNHPISEEVIEKEKQIEIKNTPTGWLNVRQGPGTSYPQITKVYPGESYPLLEEKGDWCKIKISDKVEGWVISQYVNKN